jgi:hypothetical protein
MYNRSHFTLEKIFRSIIGLLEFGRFTGATPPVEKAAKQRACHATLIVVTNANQANSS